MRTVAVLAAASLAVAAAASVTACQSKSTAAGSAPAATSPSAASAAAAGATSAAAGNSGPSGSVKNFDVCTALTAAAASQITGTTFTTTKADSSAGFIFSCEYHGANSALLEVTVTTMDGKDDFDTDVSALKEVGHPPNSVSGVGDEAYSEPDPKGNAGAVGAAADATYGAVFGDTYIQVAGLTYVNAAQGKQIVEDLHAKL